VTRTARVDLPTGGRTPPEAFSLASGVTVQLCRTSVQAAGEPSTRITLLLDARGAGMLSEADLTQALTQVPSPGIVAGLVSAGSGLVDVVTLPEFVDASEDLALAAAVCSASWGWDESERIHVTVNGRGWDVTADCRAGAWRAAVVGRH